MVVLIDDDKLVHLMWKREASNSNIELQSFFTVKEFLANQSKFGKDTTIFIDSNLADGKKGEEEAEKVYSAGFQNIILTTGYAKEDIENTQWIKDVVGKRPRFR